jgi:hypothetical protein
LKTAPIDGPNLLLIAPYLPLKGLTPRGFVPVWSPWRAAMAGVLPGWLIIVTASALMLFSVFCFGAAVWRHLYPGPPPPVPDAARINPASLILTAFLSIVSIAALIGMWFAV